MFSYTVPILKADRCLFVSIDLGDEKQKNTHRQIDGQTDGGTVIWRISDLRNYHDDKIDLDRNLNF